MICSRYKIALMNKPLKYRVLVYSGQLDVIIGAALTESFLKVLPWNGLDQCVSHHLLSQAVLRQMLLALACLRTLRLSISRSLSLSLSVCLSLCVFLSLSLSLCKCVRMCVCACLCACLYIRVGCAAVRSFTCAFATARNQGIMRRKRWCGASARMIRKWLDTSERSQNATHLLLSYSLSLSLPSMRVLCVFVCVRVRVPACVFFVNGSVYLHNENSQNLCIELRLATSRTLSSVERVTCAHTTSRKGH